MDSYKLSRDDYMEDNEVNLPDDFNDSDDSILKCLIQSLFNVKKGYIYYHKEEDGKPFPQTERVFAYEFYRQWATKVNDLYGVDYIVNGEPEKNRVSTCRKSKHLYPDLVMHHSQGDVTKQGIVCEIKRKEGLSYLSFRNDIEKLSYFVDKKKCKYTFQFGVFILVGSDMGEIIKVISETDKGLLKFNENSDLSPKIICITYDGQTMEAIQLSKLISMSPQERKIEINNYK